MQYLLGNISRQALAPARPPSYNAVMKLTSLTISLLLGLSLLACSEASGQSTNATSIPTIQVDPRLVGIKLAMDTLSFTTAAAIRARIDQQPEAFFRLLDAARQQALAADGLLRLVDKQHILPADYIPTDLVNLAEYQFDLARNPMLLRQAAMEDLLAMVAAARAKGISLLISSSFRSYEYQSEVYPRHVNTMGLAGANQVSARPGHSQHQLGTAIDFGSITDAFASTAAGQWLVAEAWRFGFSLSYPRGLTAITGYNWESWHYRYLGRAACQLEHDYFDGIQQQLLEFLAAYFTD